MNSVQEAQLRWPSFVSFPLVTMSTFLLSSEDFLVNSDITALVVTCLSCFRSDFSLSFCFDTPQLKERLPAINSMVSFFLFDAN